eukprot:PRCOL_00003857-RA
MSSKEGVPLFANVYESARWTYTVAALAGACVWLLVLFRSSTGDTSQWMFGKAGP